MTLSAPGAFRQLSASFDTVPGVSASCKASSSSGAKEFLPGTLLCMNTAFRTWYSRKSNAKMTESFGSEKRPQGEMTRKAMMNRQYEANAAFGIAPIGSMAASVQDIQNGSGKTRQLGCVVSVSGLRNHRTWKYETTLYTATLRASNGQTTPCTVYERTYASS